MCDARLWLVLQQIDEDLAAAARGTGCPCGGVLHSARYPRKPRGGPAHLSDDYRKRFSFCCAEEGCRQRTTPPSARFLGRKVYLGAVVVLATALRQGSTPWRLRRLRELFGTLSARTLARWRDFWRVTFVQSPFWRAARGRFLPPVAAAELPGALLERFTGAQPLALLLTFIAPITTTSGTGGGRGW
jgi:hypothetical protein